MLRSRYKSALTSECDKCFICGTYGALEWHHIFGGANRRNSEKYNLVVPLCHACHNEPPAGVHFNRAAMDELRRQGQRAFEKTHSRQEFIKTFGRNYL